MPALDSTRTLEEPQKGQLIEAEDLLIGATALHRQLKLATSNIRHFERIEGLVLI